MIDEFCIVVNFPYWGYRIISSIRPLHAGPPGRHPRLSEEQVVLKPEEPEEEYLTELSDQYKDGTTRR
jgi:hypothetical protein